MSRSAFTWSSMYLAQRLAVLLAACSATGCMLLRCGVAIGVAPATAAGEIAAGSYAVHTLEYAMQGTQNDVNVVLADTLLARGLRVYVTRAACTSFLPNAPLWVNYQPPRVQDPCAIISNGRFTYASKRWEPRARRAVPVTAAIVGSYEMAGAATYKVWIVGDAAAPLKYEIHVTWARGRDC